jgi:hypothetical protein
LPTPTVPTRGNGSIWLVCQNLRDEGEGAIQRLHSVTDLPALLLRGKLLERRQDPWRRPAHATPQRSFSRWLHRT